MDQVIKNVAKTRAACGLDKHTGPRIVRGCTDPLLGEEARIDASYFHGLDGLGNNNFPEEDCGTKEDHAKQQQRQQHVAAQHLIDLCQDAHNQNIEVSVVLLGPLTNLATAMKMNDTFHKKVYEFIIMGGLN